MKVEVDDLGAPNSPYVFCGRKETLNSNSSKLSELGSCVKVEVAVLGSLPLTVLMAVSYTHLRAHETG